MAHTNYLWYNMFIIIIVGLFLVPNLNAKNMDINSVFSGNTIRNMYDMLLMKCQERKIKIDEEKLTTMRNELDKCMRPLYPKLLVLASNFKSMEGVKNDMLSGKSLTPLQIQQIKQVVEEICDVSKISRDCTTKDTKYLISQCSNKFEFEIKIVEYIELTSQSICKSGGEQLIEFFMKNGMSCLPNFQDVGGKCFENNPVIEKYRNQQDVSLSVSELCDMTTNLHACGAQTLDACPIKEATSGLHAILADVDKTWSTTHCSHSSGLSSNLKYTTLLLLFVFFIYSFFPKFGIE